MSVCVCVFRTCVALQARKGKFKHTHTHTHVLTLTRRTNMQAGITEWAYRVFAEKDKLLQHFDTHGCFPGSPNKLPRSTGTQMM